VIGPAAAVVDLAALRSRVHRVVGEPTSGPVERVLVSSSNQGDGIDSGNAAATFQNPGAGQNFHYLGRLQGYLVDLPPGWHPGRAVPEVMELHGYNGFYDEEYFLAPKERAAVEQAGYLGVYPLGRGDVQYEHDGELDVLEVQRAVEHDYAVDPSRVHLVGISMGGFGATKMAVRHADVFADASVFVGGEEGDANVVNDRLADGTLTRAVAQVVGNLQDNSAAPGRLGRRRRRGGRCRERALRTAAHARRRGAREAVPRRHARACHHRSRRPPDGAAVAARGSSGGAGSGPVRVRHQLGLRRADR